MQRFINVFLESFDRHIGHQRSPCSDQRCSVEHGILLLEVCLRLSFAEVPALGSCPGSSGGSYGVETDEACRCLNLKNALK